MKKNNLVSVNFHLWEPCNFRCKFCFASFQDVKKTILPKGHLPKEQAMQVVKLLSESGFQKITFAGGEPTLCPWIGDLILLARESGMTTNLVTNGWMLLKKPELLRDLSRNLRWLTLSIDSLNTETNTSSGRALASRQPIAKEQYRLLIEQARRLGMRIKINTVVHQLNWQEPLWELMAEVKPERWKIFQVLPVAGQNDLHYEDYSISHEKFGAFLNLNEKAKQFTTIVPETNQLMRASYVMIDPAGRFFDNDSGKHRYSQPILSVGIDNAIEQIKFDSEKFNERGGLYNW
ncbi:MAG: viperin family antiviral radical SAM protein [Bacteroidota bacterium]